MTSRDHVSRLRRLHRLQLTHYGSCEDLYQAHLEGGCEELQLTRGRVSRVQHGNCEVLASRSDAPPGTSRPVGETLCARVVEEDETLAIHDVRLHESLGNHPACREGIQAYLGTPIHVGGYLFGTLSFSDTRPRSEAFAEEEVEFIELMADAIGQALERDLLDRERRAAVQHMEEQTSLFEGAFNHAAIGMALVATDGRWLRVNEALCRMFGYSEAELLRIDFQTITHPEDLDSDLEQLQEVLEGQRDTYQMKKRYIHHDGSTVWGLLTVSTVRDRDGTPRFFISQIDDITQQVHAENALKIRQRQLEAANQQLDALARTDSLTGLANRREFMNRLEQELRRSQRNGQPLSVVVLDVDHFKEYNDTWGHPEGDLALKTVADTLRDNARDMDLVVRHGGEEFALLLPETRGDQAREVAERIRVQVDSIRSLKQRISVSLGVKGFDPATDRGLQQAKPPIEAMLEASDAALYEAKSEGRNRVKLAH
jgi:diguanylate cyclase (GGDEF)-like protein/PAS domain S-box-containing protein